METVPGVSATTAVAAGHAVGGGGASSTKVVGTAAPFADKASISRRLNQELMQLMMSGSKEVSAFPKGDNLFEWVATLHGSKGTVYEGLVFKLSIKFPSDYPFTAPTITFTTPCFHPNVDQYGNICVDFLKDKWSAAYSVSSLLLSLQSLLADPNNASPLNSQAAALWADGKEYRKVLLKKYREATGSAPDE